MPGVAVPEGRLRVAASVVGCGRLRGFRGREPARDRGSEGPGPGRDRPRDPPRHRDRLLDVGAAADAPAGRHDAARALRGGAPVQPGLSPAARRGLRRRAHRARGRGPRRRALRADRDEGAAGPQGGGRLHRRPSARSPVARGALARERRRRHDGGDRRRGPLRRRAPLELHGHLPDLSARGRRGRHAALPGAVRPCPETALDASRSARTDRGPRRPGGDAIGRPGRRHLDPRPRTQARRLPRGGARCPAVAGLRRGAVVKAHEKALEARLETATVGGDDTSPLAPGADGCWRSGSTTTAT